MSRAMKESGIPWIGAIPQDWLLCRIKNKFNTISGATPKTDDISCWDGDVIWVTPADYKTEDRFIIKGRRNITLFGVNSCGTTIVPEGSVIFSKRAPIGLVAVNKVPLCTNQGCISCLPKKECLNTYYYYIMSILTAQFELYGSGTTFKEISASAFTNFAMIAPSYPEQRAIADFLDVQCEQVDELIALQEQMIDELKVYKQSVITQAVTKGLNPDAPLTDSGIEWIGQIPEHWKIVPFKTTYRLAKGLTITKADLIESGVPVISYGQIHSKLNTGTNIIDRLIRYVPESFIIDNSNSLVGRGDIIFADTSEDLEGCGNCVYIDREMVLFAGYHTIIAKNTFGSSSKYIAYLFKTDCWRYQLRTSVNGVKLFSISQKILANTSVLLPSEIEQQQIADYLDKKCAEIDEMTSIKQQKIEQLKEYKKSIIYEYATGKKQVNRE